MSDSMSTSGSASGSHPASNPGANPESTSTSSSESTSGPTPGSPPGPRDVPDKCPGLVRPYPSADGLIVRLRSGGRPLPVATLRMVSALATEYGDRTVQITSRGGLQLRALPEPLPGELSDRIVHAGLLPSDTHELVRNIITSPLTGLDGGLDDLRDLAREFDEALCADAALAHLPGRFLVAFDDGRGDVLGEHVDLGYQATGPGGGAVYAGGHERGWHVARADVIPALLALAHAFLVARAALEPIPWRVDELPEPLDAGLDAPAAGPGTVAAGRTPLGVAGSSVVAGVPLGLLTPDHIDAIAAAARAAGSDTVVISPWRSVVVPGGAGASEELTHAGLICSEESAWARIGACTGSPGCARSTIDTHSLARDLAEGLDLDPEGGTAPIYISGCDRRCGSPAGTYVDLLAPTSLAAAVAQVRGQ